MNPYFVPFRKAVPVTVSVIAWGWFGLVPIIQAADPATPPATVEDQASSPPQKSDVQERGIRRAPIQGLQPSVTAPLQYVGPTDNLTKVINALSRKHKSLTTIITAAPGLQLTQPVEISVGFYSPWGTNSRITQTYVKKFGNRLVYHDPEGEGTPRRLRMDIWLTEPKPGGGLYTYSLSWQADLDPLYDITVSPLMFTLMSNCDYFGGNSEIRFAWYPPGSDYQRFNFVTTKGRVVSIQQFAWARAEVSASANLRMPRMMFKEHDPPNPLDFSFEGTIPIILPQAAYLLPGKTQVFSFGLFPGQSSTGPDQIHGGGHTCLAKIEYRTTYNLRTYPNL